MASSMAEVAEGSPALQHTEMYLQVACNLHKMLKVSLTYLPGSKESMIDNSKSILPPRSCFV